MTSPPKQRERITRAALLAQIAAFHQQAAALDEVLANFTAGTELQISLQPSVLAAHRNIKASLNHLGAAQTLVEAMEEVRRG
jgi:hypothetical protein